MRAEHCTQTLLLPAIFTLLISLEFMMFKAESHYGDLWLINTLWRQYDFYSMNDLTTTLGPPLCFLDQRAWVSRPPFPLIFRREGQHFEAFIPLPMCNYVTLLRQKNRSKIKYNGIKHWSRKLFEEHNDDIAYSQYEFYCTKVVYFAQINEIF